MSQFSHSVVSNSLDCSTPDFPVHHQLPELTHTHVHWYDGYLWCHPTISSSVVPFSSCLQSFPASGSFPVSQFFASGDQSTGASASTSILPVTIQDWFPLGWTDWVSLQSKGLSRVWKFRTINSLASVTHYKVLSSISVHHTLVNSTTSPPFPHSLLMAITTSFRYCQVVPETQVCPGKTP